MKKSCCILLALLLVLAMFPLYVSAETAVEEPFTMWHEIQFGDTIEEVKEKCDIKEEDVDIYDNRGDGPNGRASMYVRSKTEVAGVMMYLSFYFDENGKLTDFFLNSTQDFETKMNDQDKIRFALTEKYRGYEVYGTDAYERFPGIVIDEYVNEQTEFTSNDMFIRKYTIDSALFNGWMIPLNEGGAVKIECLYEEHTKDQKCIGGNDLAKSMGTWTKKENYFCWGYSYFSSEELEGTTIDIKGDL